MRMIGFAAPRDFPEGEIRVLKLTFSQQRERERGEGKAKGEREEKRVREQLEKKLACLTLTPRHASGVACNKL